MGRFIADRPFIVALDFDGTIKQGKFYNHDWETWELTPGFREFVEWSRSQNIKLVLWTCRNMDDKRDFESVYNFLKKKDLLSDIVLHFEQGTPYEFKGQLCYFWGTGSLKQYADMYVDDLAIGFPVLEPSGDPDWPRIQKLVEIGMRG